MPTKNGKLLKHELINLILRHGEDQPIFDPNEELPKLSRLWLSKYTKKQLLTLLPQTEPSPGTD